MINTSTNPVNSWINSSISSNIANSINTTGSTVLSNNLGNYYSYSFDLESMLSKEDREKLLTRLLEDEDDLMPILKKYLVGYLDQFMENPESILKDLIKEKDNKINDLEKKIEDLEKKIDSITCPPLPNIPLGPNPYDPYHPSWLPDITWTGDANSITCSSDNSTNIF